MGKLVNEIICGDCIDILGKVKKPFADLIFADPPFNIGYKYDKYYDKKKRKNYIAWTKQWMQVCCNNALKDKGSFYIAIGDDYAAEVKIIADELGLIMRNWIIWHYTFGQQTRNKFARAHTHIFYFIKDKKNFTFNDYAVRVPSDRQLIYNDKRANSKGKMPDDVWNSFSRVCGTFKERQGWHPCQMPENLLARIIKASSNAGDCVLDPFVGSGTTCAVARLYERSYSGIDISEQYVENAKKRLEEVSNDSLFFSKVELAELKRLYVETAIGANKILADKKLLRTVTNQFILRMNNNRQYDPAEIATAIKDFSY